MIGILTACLHAVFFMGCTPKFETWYLFSAYFSFTCTQLRFVQLLNQAFIIIIIIIITTYIVISTNTPLQTKVYHVSLSVQ